jgi:hypothetical protein
MAKKRKATTGGTASAAEGGRVVVSLTFEQRDQAMAALYAIEGALASLHLLFD